MGIIIGLSNKNSYFLFLCEWGTKRSHSVWCFKRFKGNILYHLHGGLLATRGNAYIMLLYYLAEGLGRERRALRTLVNVIAFVYKN